MQKSKCHQMWTMRRVKVSTATMCLPLAQYCILTNFVQENFHSPVLLDLLFRMKFSFSTICKYSTSFGHLRPSPLLLVTHCTAHFKHVFSCCPSYAAVIDSCRPYAPNVSCYLARHDPQQVLGYVCVNRRIEARANTRPNVMCHSGGRFLPCDCGREGLAILCGRCIARIGF